MTTEGPVSTDPEYVRGLESEVVRLKQEIANRDAVILSLQETVKELTRRTKMNSANSSKPPSSDGYNKPKPKSLREKTGRKPGGQPGHKGSGIKLPHPPDEVIEHLPVRCTGCPNLTKCASGGVFSCAESRFVIEAVVSTKVVQHCRMDATCPLAYTGDDMSGSMPEDLSAHIQYGDSFTVIVGLLDTFGAVSDERNSQIVRSLFGVTLSPGTVVNMTARCAEKVSETMEKVSEEIGKEKVNHRDETGVYVDGKLHWVHTASTENYTRQTISPKRGKEGIESNGDVRNYKGVMVHDCFGPYWDYTEAQHAVCCAHLLRELNAIEESEPGRKWPGRFKVLLLDMKSAKEAAIAEGKVALDPKRLKSFERRYSRILRDAEKECPKPQIHRGKNGALYIKRGKELSLLFRLQHYRDAVCMYVKDLDVPFDNNLAERDLRNLKGKTKISGGFRSLEHAQYYLDVMSFLSTARKHGISMFEALTAAFNGMADIVLGHRFSEGFGTPSREGVLNSYSERCI